MHFIETIRIENGTAPLLPWHLKRLQSGLYQNDFYHRVEELSLAFERAVIHSLPKEKGLFRMRALIFPEEAASTVKIEVLPFIDTKPIINIGLYHKIKKPILKPFNAKTDIRSIYEHAQAFAQSKGLDDAIVTCENGFIADAGIYAVFALKKGVFYTPPLKDMPVHSVWKRFVMECGIWPVVEKSLLPEDLLLADELWLGNALRFWKKGVLSF